MNAMTNTKNSNTQVASVDKQPIPNQSGIVKSEILLQGEKELLIEHLGQIYRLQATRQGKLILVK